jgi:hypothetical protein
MTAALADEPVALAMNSDFRPQWQQIRELTLAALPNAVPCALLLVQQARYDWQLDAATIKTAEDLLRELVAHAVDTTGIVEELPSYSEAFDHLTVIRVRLHLMPDRLVLAVLDSGSEIPEAHRGLTEVSARSLEWGSYQPRRGNRVVWCAIDTTMWPEAEDTRLATSLPRRTRQSFPQPDEPLRIVRDPHLLQRVLNGLRALDQEAPEE